MPHKYDPDYAVHPGETVRECMEMYNMTPWTIASAYPERTMIEHGYRQRMACHVTEVVTGERSIDEELAFVFEDVFHIPDAFWLERQRIYDERVAKIQGDRQ